MVVLADAADVPLELVARLAGEDGYLTVVEALGRRDVDAPRDHAGAIADRAKQATIAVGGNRNAAGVQFPLRERELPISAERVIANWNTTLDGQAPRVLEEQLVRRIRQWQPEVIIAPCASQGSRAEDAIIQKAVLEATF